VYSVTQSGGYDSNQNYLTDVGAFSGSGSFYGTFDQSGNVFQWNDLDDTPGASRGLRGGYWGDSDPLYLSSSGSYLLAPTFENVSVGFRLASPVAVPEPSTCASLLAGLACGGWQMWRRRKRCNRASKAATSLALAAVFFCATNAHAQVTIDMVTVGDPGNANDTTSYGGVNYSYQIGKYDVTIGQYTDFLNAVAATDTYSLYNASMATDLNLAGIARTGSSGSYTYSAIAPSGTTPAGASSPGNRPITYVNWFDSARFANWMANGQPTGVQSSTTTENGAYNVNGATIGNAPAKNVTNPNTSAAPTFFIPNENEWYKAAYYSPVLNSGSGGYYTYATQSNAAPGNVIGSGTNQANYNNGKFSVTQSATYSGSQNYLTDVGAFSGSGSFYGTFDQSGNVFQWNDLDGTSGSDRGLRGGSWDIDAFGLSSSYRFASGPSGENIVGVGFRLAAVPEPSTCAMALAGLACGGYSLFRRRRAR
jgi:formylglycine-generating enzyme required for sulfatase activity